MACGCICKALAPTSVMRTFRTTPHAPDCASGKLNSCSQRYHLFTSSHYKHNCRGTWDCRRPSSCCSTLSQFDAVLGQKGGQRDNISVLNTDQDGPGDMPTTTAHTFRKYNHDTDYQDICDICKDVCEFFQVLLANASFMWCLSACNHAAVHPLIVAAPHADGCRCWNRLHAQDDGTVCSRARCGHCGGTACNAAARYAEHTTCD